jgi:8-oxo-dGTP pyrophosphatase MutT (NUDIX family)
MAEHAGQIACPGGRYDADLDVSLCDTAIRETQEEVGVILSPSRLITILNPVYIPVTGYTIAPHVFRLDEIPTLIPSPEVVAFYWVSIDQLRGCEEMMAGWPQYPLSWGRVWGATARILHQLLHLRESEGKI